MNRGQKKTHYNYCRNVKKKHAWISGEALYIQALHQQKVLITEQQVSNTNPLFELVKITNTPRLKP
jgi:hypothetical protein